MCSASSCAGMTNSLAKALPEALTLPFSLSLILAQRDLFKPISAFIFVFAEGTSSVGWCFARGNDLRAEMVVIQYHAREFLVKSRQRQTLTLQHYLSLVWISQSLFEWGSGNKPTKTLTPFHVASGSFLLPGGTAETWSFLWVILWPTWEHVEVRGEKEKRRMRFSNPSIRVSLKWREFRAAVMSKLVPHILPYWSIPAWEASTVN